MFMAENSLNITKILVSFYFALNENKQIAIAM